MLGWYSFRPWGMRFDRGVCMVGGGVGSGVPCLYPLVLVGSGVSGRMVGGWVSSVRLWLWYWWPFVLVLGRYSFSRLGMRVAQSGSMVGGWGGSGVPLGSGFYSGGWLAAPLFRVRHALVGWLWYW